MRIVRTLFVLAFILVATTACNGGSNESPTAPTYPDGKPTGVNFTVGDQRVTLNWNSVNGANGYYVYISYDGSGFHRYDGGLVQGTSYSVFNLINDQTYYFGVSAVGVGGWESSIAYPGGYPTAEPAIPGIEDGPYIPPWEGVPPPAPLNLQGQAFDSSCGIRWEKYETSVPDFSFFRIYKRETIGSVSVWAVLEDSFTGPYDEDGFYAYLDGDLENGQTYGYRLTGWDNENLESNYSNSISLMPENFVPDILENVLIFVNPGRIVLEWDVPMASDITQYGIERIEGVDPITGAEIIVRFVISAPTHGPGEPELYGGGLAQVWLDIERNRIVAIDGAVTIGIVYTYRLAAIDGEGQEGPPVRITAPSAVY